MKVVVIDYGVGNLGSIPSMLARAGMHAIVSSDPSMVASADRLILPGVGAFDAGMQSLEDRGLMEPLRQRVLGDRVPTLGLCLGMHLLFESSEEGRRAGLGWMPGTVVRFQPSRMAPPLPVPNMGWLDAVPIREDPILADLDDDARFYFAHSYHAAPSDPSSILATADYGYSFPICVRRDNIVAAQFHPEKSHRFGLQFLSNFVAA
jgi:imidazole glycerol-phosphate synthase subunit HisH